MHGKKFRELSPILTLKGAFLKLKGKVYGFQFVQSCIMYESETWSTKEGHESMLERTEIRMGLSGYVVPFREI